MIRIAERSDLEQIIELLKGFRAESPLPALKDSNDEEYVKKQLDHVFAGAGRIWLYERDQSAQGLIIGLINRSFWHPGVLYMNELAFWVKPEYRQSRAGWHLLKAYTDWGYELKQKNRISFFVVTKMVNSPDLRYERYGYTKLEENWRA